MLDSFHTAKVYGPLDRPASRRYKAVARFDGKVTVSWGR
jgi:hypothetical protein